MEPTLGPAGAFEWKLPSCKQLFRVQMFAIFICPDVCCSDTSHSIFLTIWNRRPFWLGFLGLVGVFFKPKRFFYLQGWVDKEYFL